MILAIIGGILFQYVKDCGVDWLDRVDREKKERDFEPKFRSYK